MTSSSPHILVVEDDAATQLLLATVLRRHDLRCTLAGDGESAIEWLQRIRFDAVVLDLVLPRVNGFDVLGHIAWTLPELLPRVVVCTALMPHLFRDRIELHKVGATFVKPVEILEIAEAVVRVSGGRAPSPASESRSTRTLPFRLPGGR